MSLAASSEVDGSLGAVDDFTKENGRDEIGGSFAFVASCLIGVVYVG